MASKLPDETGNYWLFVRGNWLPARVVVWDTSLNIVAKEVYFFGNEVPWSEHKLGDFTVGPKIEPPQ